LPECIGECKQRLHRNGYECIDKGQNAIDYKVEGGSLVAERQSGRAVVWLEQWSGKIVEFT